MVRRSIRRYGHAGSRDEPLVPLAPATGAVPRRGKRAQPVPFAGDLDYLQEELRWIEVRAQRIAADRALAQQVAGRGQRAVRLRSEDDEPVQPETLRARVRQLRREEQHLRTAIDARRLAGGPELLALDRLCATYALDGFARTVLLLATAPCFSLGFEDLFGELNRDGMRSCLDVETIFAFTETPFADRIQRRGAFSRRGPLVLHDLIAAPQMGGRYQSPKDLLAAEIEINNRTLGFLLGVSDVAEEFLEFSSLEDPRASFEQVVLPAKDQQRLLSVVERHEQYLACRQAWGFDEVIRYGRGVLMLFHGKPGTGKTMTAHAIAHRLGKRVLNVDLPTFVEHRESHHFLPGLFREARLQNALLFFDECETLFASRAQGNSLMTLLLTELERFEGVAVLATNLPQVLDEALERRILVKVHFPEPDRQARQEIWRRHLPPAAPLAADVDLAGLAERYELAGGYIKNAVLMAVAAAVHEAGVSPQITMAHLEEAARQQLQRPRDGECDCLVPQVTLEDVILVPAVRRQVAELIAAARSRRTVLERWGIGAHLSHGKGVSALFYGEPGTGKTLCAEAVAGELSRPLLHASLPALLSRWVGQTEQNLESLFSRARGEGAVLFLDEADSLLEERGTAHAARHEDRLVNLLLQLIKRHDGVVLLATNRPQQLDRALGRRLTYQLRFDLPDAAQRTAIWRRLLPATVPVEGVLELELLGRKYQTSGGQIKNAVFKAAFRAASGNGALTQALLEEAVQEELEGGRRQVKPIGFGVVA